MKENILPLATFVNPSLVGAALRYRDADGSYWVGCAKNWVRFRAPTSDLDAVFALLDGSRSLESFLEKALTIAPHLGKKQILHMLQALAHRGLLMDGHPVLPSALKGDTEYLERHSRDLEFYALFERENASRYDYLERLRSARVAVIGLGGLGSWLSLSLACIGIGELVGVDFDRVELSNLARQILYTPDDLDQPKVEVAQAFFAHFSPEMQFRPSCLKINGSEDAVPLLKNIDFVILAADWPHRHIGRWVNQACMQVGVPALYMSASASYTRIGPLVMPGQSGCYECFSLQRQQSESDNASLISASQREEWLADPVPAISPIPGLTGHMLAWEVLCALTGIQQPCTLEHILRLDFTTFETKRFPLTKEPTCPVCAAFARNEQHTNACEQEIQLSSREGDEDA